MCQYIIQVDDTLLPGDASEHSVPLKRCRCIAEAKREDPNCHNPLLVQNVVMGLVSGAKGHWR